MLRILVNANGKVVQAEVEKSSGYKRLDELARTDAFATDFEPATVDGKPQQVWVSVPFTYRLQTD